MNSVTLIKVANGYIFSYATSQGQMNYVYRTLQEVVEVMAYHFQDQQYINEHLNKSDESIEGISDTLPS